MARFKPVHKGMKLLPVDFDRQLVPGTFDHALDYLVDHELDLSTLEARYRNDEQGASAYTASAWEIATKHRLGILDIDGPPVTHPAWRFCSPRP